MITWDIKAVSDYFGIEPKRDVAASRERFIYRLTVGSIPVDLVIVPRGDHCQILPDSTSAAETVTAYIHCSEILVLEDEDLQWHVSLVGKGGHVCITRTDHDCRLFFSMYGEKPAA